MSRVARLTRHFRPRLWRAPLVPFVGLALASCATQRVEPRPSSGEMAAVAPMLSVERFLQAANAGDFEAMARLFGTADGPVKGDRKQIELEMATIAEILRHRDYQIVSERRAPGRENPTHRVDVDLTNPAGRVIREVPFHVVQSDDGRWLVEEIDLEKVTGT